MVSAKKVRTYAHTICISRLVTLGRFCFWLLWVLVAVHRLSLVAASGGHFLVPKRGLLLAVASLAVEHGL